MNASASTCNNTSGILYQSTILADNENISHTSQYSSPKRRLMAAKAQDAEIEKQVGEEHIVND